jgi:uncharacterized membrane protein
MATSYNDIVGHAVERIVSLSDEIFAVGMTLLVLGLRLPVPSAIHTNRDLEIALLGLVPELTTSLLSFMTLGIFWLGHQTQLHFLARSDRHLTWIHLGFLFAVTLSPFSTKLLYDFVEYRVALVIYWANIFALGAILYGGWGYAVRAGLLKADTAPDIPAAVCRRIVVAQALYAVGAALCVINTYWSIGFILLVQINYVLALKSRWALRD